MSVYKIHNEKQSNRLSHTVWLSLIVLVAVLFALTITIVNGSITLSDKSVLTLVLFALNGVIGLIFLSKSILDAPVSLVQIHWMFYVTMFVIAPVSQYLYNYSPWGYAISSDIYAQTNILIMLWGLLFGLLTSLKKNAPLHEVLSEPSFFHKFPRIGTSSEWIIFLIALAATLITVYLVGFSNLFLRADFTTNLDKTSGLIFDKFIRPMPVFAFALLFIRYKQTRSLSPLLILTFVMVLLADFPTAMARYNMACIYGGLALLVFSPLREKRGLFPVIFLLAFLVVLPAGNSYRFESISFFDFIESILAAFSNLSQGFCAVDYDAYSMVARTWLYVRDIGISYGYQLLGVLLFFVPRSFWPSKPEGSGNLVAEAQGQAQLNISSPLPAEGLINFGIVGLVIFAVLLAILCRRADSWYQRSNSPFTVFCFFAYFLLFFVCRGDLLSSFAFAAGYFVVYTVLAAIAFGPNLFKKSTRVASNSRYADAALDSDARMLRT